MPTVGFKVEQFTKNNIAFTMFDMSGASTHRDLWTAYYGECDAVIYVVDCKDKLRICVAKKELDDMLAAVHAEEQAQPARAFSFGATMVVPCSLEQAGSTASTVPEEETVADLEDAEATEAEAGG